MALVTAASACLRQMRLPRPTRICFAAAAGIVFGVRTRIWASTSAALTYWEGPCCPPVLLTSGTVDLHRRTTAVPDTHGTKVETARTLWACAAASCSCPARSIRGLQDWEKVGPTCSVCWKALDLIPFGRSTVNSCRYLSLISLFFFFFFFFFFPPLFFFYFFFLGCLD